MALRFGLTACEDTIHQAIAMKPGRVFEVIDANCVACNPCVNVKAAQQGSIDCRPLSGACSARSPRPLKPKGACKHATDATDPSQGQVPGSALLPAPYLPTSL